MALDSKPTYWSRWKRFAHRAAEVQSNVLLGALYFLVVLPIALVRRPARSRPAARPAGRQAGGAAGHRHRAAPVLMRVLGISCYFHDAAAAILCDGVVTAAAEEERFSRVKHDFGFPRRAIRFCLEQAGVSGADLDYVAFFEKPLVKFDRILQTALDTAPRSSGVFRKAMTAWLLDKLWVKNLIVREVGIAPDRVLFVEHHLSHAASAFYCSPFQDAAIITVDGVGEWTTTALGRGDGLTIS